MSEQETAPGPIGDYGRHRKRLTFDPTINAGHLLTAATMTAALVAGWNLLDKRVVVLEEAKIYQRERDTARDAAVKEKLTELQEGVRDVRRVLENIQRNGK